MVASSKTRRRPKPVELITTHPGPDFDGLAAMFGVQKLHPDALVATEGRLEPAVRDFLSLHGDLFRLTPLNEVDLSAVTRLITVDIAHRRRLGTLAALFDREDLRVTAYDHHPPQSDGFGPRARLIHKPYGAVTTLVVEMLEQRRVPIAPVEATLFALGIAADTGSLSYNSVTPQDCFAMGRLLEQGAQMELVQRFLAQRLESEQLALLEQCSERIERFEVQGARVAIACAETERAVSDVNLLAGRLLAHADVEALFLLAAMQGKVLIVGRSRSTAIDVLAALAPFGAGGHHGAAAVTLAARPLEELKRELLRNLEQSMQGAVRARDIMSSPVHSVRADETIETAHATLLRSGHSGLVVVDPDGRIAGILSRKDVDKALAHDLGHAPVRAYMTKEPITISSDTPLYRLSALIAEHNVGRLPVLDDGKLIGIVTRSDVIRMLHLEDKRREIPLIQEIGNAKIADGLSRLPETLRLAIDQAGSIGDELGLPVYLVGGLLRDLLLGRRSIDLDFVVEGDASLVARKLAHRLELPVDYHARFGTAQIRLPEDWNAGPHIDLATARGEWYAHPGALPEVQPGSGVDDALRRDFTINALALRLNGKSGQRGLLSDVWGGVADLQAGMIRVLHPLSFVDDPTRIFRAIRFAARFQFEIEARTEELLRRAVADGMLSRVSPQRVRAEIELIVGEEHPGRALLLGVELGIWNRLHPGWTPHLPALTEDGLFALQAQRWRALAPDTEATAGRLALLALFSPLSALPLRSLIERFAFDAATAALLSPAEESGAALRAALRQAIDVGSATPSAVHKLLASIPETALAYFDMVWSDAAEERALLEREFKVTRRVALEIGGKDLIAAGIPAGPEIGATLARLLSAKQDGVLHGGREEELKWALER